MPETAEIKYNSGSKYKFRNTSTLREISEAERVIERSEVKIVGNKLTFRKGRKGYAGGHQVTEKQLENLNKSKRSGKISSSRKSKIKEQLTLFSEAVRTHNWKQVRSGQRRFRKLVMITLTLSETQNHSDIWIRRYMLDPFLKKLKYNHDVRNYFHRSEKQENGNIHFHLIVDQYIDKKLVQKYWNSLQKRHGYLDVYYFLKGSYSAPSTHVKGLLYTLKSINYVMKYMTKDEGEHKVEGRLWGMSDSLRELVASQVNLDEQTKNKIVKALKRHDARLILDDYFTVIIFKSIKIAVVVVESLWNLLHDFKEYNYYVLYDTF